MEGISSGNDSCLLNADKEFIYKSKFPLHKVCRDGDCEELSLLLVQNGQHSIYDEDFFHGWTPAHWAAYNGNLNCLDILLRAGYHCESATSTLKQAASHHAAFSNHNLCLKLLIHYGVKLDLKFDCLKKLMSLTAVGVNAGITSQHLNQTPLHVAAFRNQYACLELILKSAIDLNFQDYLGETALHKAARSGSMECLSLLISHGANLMLENNVGLTACKLAAQCGFLEASKFLSFAVDPNFHNYHHSTFLANNNFNSLHNGATGGFTTHWNSRIPQNNCDNIEIMETNDSLPDMLYHPNDFLVCESTARTYLGGKANNRKRAAESFCDNNAGKRKCSIGIMESELNTIPAPRPTIPPANPPSSKDFCGIYNSRNFNSKLTGCFISHYM